MKALRRIAAATGLATVLGFAGRLRGRRTTLERVAPDLRHPSLYFSVKVRGNVSMRIFRALFFPTKVLPGIELSEETATSRDGLRVKLYRYDSPEREHPSGALLWLHGGGGFAGRVAQDHDLCSLFVRDAGVVVFSVDYRLAPENPFPAALDDCVAALEWMHLRAADLGIDVDRIAVGGASAGAGIATALTHRVHDEGGPAIAFQLLEYPWLDDRTTLREVPAGAVHVWAPESNHYAWTVYLGRPPSSDGHIEYAIPGRREDLSGLPPAWVGVGDLDLFHDEDVEYAQRLRAAGVACELHVVPGMYHGADMVAPKTATTRAFRARMVDALREGLSKASVSS